MLKLAEIVVFLFKQDQCIMAEKDKKMHLDFQIHWKEQKKHALEILFYQRLTKPLSIIKCWV